MLIAMELDAQTPLGGMREARRRVLRTGMGNPGIADRLANAALGRNLLDSGGSGGLPSYTAPSAILDGDGRITHEERGMSQAAVLSKVAAIVGP